jgi:hypothetical protein
MSRREERIQHEEADEESPNRRLNIRISLEDHTMLREIRDILKLDTDSNAIRTLIRLHHTTMRVEVNRLRSLRRRAEQE